MKKARLLPWALVAILASSVSAATANDVPKQAQAKTSKTAQMTEAQPERAVDKLLAHTVAGLRAAKGNPEKIKRAIEQYLKQGDALQISPAELRDHFDISSPSLPEKAGFSSSESDAAAKIYDKVSAARYRK